MSRFVLIMAVVLLCLSVTYLVLQRFNLLSKSKILNKNKIPPFLSDEEAVKFISQRVVLTEDERVHLETLLSLVSGSRLHQGFEDLDVIKKWLVVVRRAIANSNQLDQSAKEDLEYYAYEIYRKINNERMISHPSVKHLTDINIGQPMTIQIGDMEINGTMIDSNFYSCAVEISKQDSQTIKNLRLDKKRVKVSFWKIMDAQYSFDTVVSGVDKKSGAVTLILSNPKSIDCMKIRSYPRQEVEIPVKFRMASMSTDPDTGALMESYGGILFGITNNIGPWGCSILSNAAVPIHTSLLVDLPIFSQILYIKGIVRNVNRKGDVFLLNVEFDDNTRKSNILKIYHYIFAEDTSKS